MSGYEIWRRTSPPRYSPATRTRNRQSEPVSPSVASINSIVSQNLVRDQHPTLSWCSFQVPSSDGLIVDDTREGIPAYPVPDENDGFTVVRRYLYDVLTGTGWGVSYKYPAAIRATVESWYGNGGYFRTLFAADGGLSNLCPEIGKDGGGKEVEFHGKTRELIDTCVRHETRMLLHQEADPEDVLSQADRHVDGNTSNIIAQEKACLKQNRGKGKHPTFTLEPLHGSTTSCQTVQSDARDSAKLITSSKTLIVPELKTEDSFRIKHENAAQVHISKSKQSEKQERQGARPSVMDGVNAGYKPVVKHSMLSHSDVSTPKPSHKDVSTPKPSHKDVATPEPTRKDASTPTPPPRPSYIEERRCGLKHARCNPTLSTENVAGVASQINRKRSTKAVKQIPRIPLSNAFSQSSIKSTRYEALPSSKKLPLTEETLLVDVATRAANKAKQLARNVDEARQLNHHNRTGERKKGNIFSKVFGRLSGKRS